VWVNSVALFQSQSEGNRILRSGILRAHTILIEISFGFHPLRSTIMHCKSHENGLRKLGCEDGDE
jgi:hypothetical protein